MNRAQLLPLAVTVMAGPPARLPPMNFCKRVSLNPPPDLSIECKVRLVVLD